MLVKRIIKFERLKISYVQIRLVFADSVTYLFTTIDLCELLCDYALSVVVRITELTTVCTNDQ